MGRRGRANRNNFPTEVTSKFMKFLHDNDYPDIIKRENLKNIYEKEFAETLLQFGAGYGKVKFRDVLLYLRRSKLIHELGDYYSFGEDVQGLFESLIGSEEHRQTLEDWKAKADTTPYFCDVCGIQCPGEKDFEQHKNGARHRIHKFHYEIYRNRKAALLGSFHQGQPHFKGAGRQCSCTSQAAMMHSIQKNPKEWTTMDMDTILAQGDKIYTIIQSEQNTSEHLLVTDLPVKYTYNGNNYTMKILKTCSGTLDRKLTDMPFMSLEDAFTDMQSFCFLTLGCYTMSVLRQDDCYFVYDSHSRNDFGMSCPDGRSVLTAHLGLKSLCSFVHHLAATLLPKLNAAVFEVTHVEISNQSDKDSSSDDSDFEGFSEISEGDYVCRMQMLEDDLKMKLDQIENESILEVDVSENEEQETCDEQDREIQNENANGSIPFSESEELFTASKLMQPASFLSNDETDANVYTDSEPELNDSFVDRVIIEGLMNESNISLDFLGDSDDNNKVDDAQEDDDNVPLNILKEKLLLLNAEKDTRTENAFNETKPGEANRDKLQSQSRNTDSNIKAEVNMQNAQENIRMMNTGMQTESSGNETSRSRKRTRNEVSWKRNIAKKKRNTGQEYVSLQKQIRRGRKMRNGCNTGCRYKCHSKITEEERQTIFHEYWRIGDVNRQRDYIANRVHSKPKKNKTCTKEPVNRQFSRKWQLKVGHQYIPVCKTFFLHTLDISHTVVDTALKKSLYKENNVSGVCSPDKRGKHTNRINKIPAAQMHAVKAHINSFPKVDSHYCRKDTSKSYLEPGLSVPKMYNLYLQHCAEKGSLPVSIYSYRYVFDTCFNLGFHRPLKDVCDFCSKYKNCSDTEKDEMKFDYDNHIKLKEWVREMKAADKARAKDDGTLVAACFDLQQVLPTPHSNETAMYYSRKLCTFNLTVYDLATRDGFAYIWNEAISRRGSCEIASCMFKFLQEQSGKGKKEVILYSDSCGGQNRNKNFVAMLSYAKSKFHFKKIEQKFYERGHSQNENDSMHAAIECRSRGVSIYTTGQWAATIRTARSKPYYVQELGPDDFLDFKALADAAPNFVYDEQGEKIKWLRIKTITFDDQDAKIVKFRYNDFTCSTMNISGRRNSGRGVKSQSLFEFPDVQPLYDMVVPPKLSVSKYKALTDLCKTNIIPSVHHNFFYSLPHHVSDQESDQE